MRTTSRRLAAIVLLLIAAICSHQASIRGWGGAPGPQTTRYTLAPNGMRQLPATGGPALVTCRWFPLRGTDPLCQAAPGEEGRFSRLTYSYPALQAGAWLSFLAMLTLLLAGTQAAGFTRGLAVLGTLAICAGIALVFAAGPGAVQALASRTFAFGGPGLVLGAIAPVLAIAAATLVPSAAPHAG
jgi:hypothetical protein